MGTRERPARTSLVEWLKVGDRSQTKLARACGVQPQTISALVRDVQLPSDELRRLLHVATAGEVAEGEWATEGEREEAAARLKRARDFGHGATGDTHGPESTRLQSDRKGNTCSGATP